MERLVVSYIVCFCNCKFSKLFYSTLVWPGSDPRSLKLTHFTSSVPAAQSIGSTGFVLGNIITIYLVIYIQNTHAKDYNL